MLKLPNEYPPVPEFPGLQQGDLFAWMRVAVDAHAIVAITDHQGVIRYANDLFCEISGYSREELIGHTHRMLKSGRHPPEFYADLWRTIASGNIWRGAICNRAKSGTYYWVQSTILPLPGPEGAPVGYIALRTEITHLKQVEEANTRLVTELTQQAAQLRLAQDHIGTFFEHAPIGISWREIGPDGKSGINHVNRRFCELIGLSAKEAEDLDSFRRVTHPDDWLEQSRLMDEIYSGERDTFSLHKRYVRPDGRTFWCTLTIVVLRDEQGRITHHYAMLEDITARKQAEDELRRTESRWRTYLGHASEILYALTPELRIKFASPAWTAKLGHSVEEVMGSDYLAFVHPEDVPACRRFIEDIVAGRDAAASVEYRMRHRDGRWIWHATTGSAYSDRDGRTAFFGVGRDISIRRQALDELRAALARREELERIIDRSPSVVVLWRAEGDAWPVEYVSASIRQFGYTPEQFICRQLTFGDITHPDDRERIRAEVIAHAESSHDEYTQEYRIVCADGAFRWVDDHTVVRRDAWGRVTHHEGLVNDITVRKQAEQAERDALERDLRVAAEIQQHFRPRVFPDIGEVEIDALSTASRLIGGDYYDVFPVGERRWGVVIADVSGKGTGAALMMAEARATLRLIAPGEASPAAVIRRLNRAIQPDMRPGMFLGLFYGVLDLDTNVMSFCRAGHEPGILLRRGGPAECLPGGGLAVGLDEGPVFDALLEEREVALSAGDMIALYTDGITEARNPRGEEFGRDRLTAALRRHAEEPLGQIIRLVERYVGQFSVYTTHQDDSTLLLLRIR